MNKTNLFIAKSIVSAQIASDSGKGIHELKENKRASYKGYCAKDACILQAVETIRNCNSIFKYAVTKGDLKDSFIIYFEFKIDNKRYQVSFHSFNKKLWKRYLTKSFNISWDHKSSRDACRVLMDIMQA